MKGFIARHGHRLVGLLSGFDRLVLRGTFRQLAHVGGLDSILATEHVLLKDFGQWAMGLTDRLKDAIRDRVLAAGRPIEYLQSAAISKEKIAREILRKSPVETGPICLLGVVEPCASFDIHRNRKRKVLQLVARHRKCQFLYLYFIDPNLGFGHIRIQTWIPFTVQICLNGREWLARQMDKARLAYRREDNVFWSVEDYGKAQRLFDRQLRTAWPGVLERLVRLLNPLQGKLFKRVQVAYYWTLYQMEWATDLVFRRADDLASLYPILVRHAMCHLRSEDVLRFLGKKLSPVLLREVTSDYRRRIEGVRVKHRVGVNSVKAYDKAPHILRVETTIHDCADLKAYRPREGDPEGVCSWRYLRKGIADLHRTAIIADGANKRYLEALAAVDPRDTTDLDTILRPVLRRTSWRGQPVRALQPFSEADGRLLQAVADGALVLKGFRNRDLVRTLHGTKRRTVAERRRLAGRVTRQIRLLRGHGLVRKVTGTHRYLLTETGRRICTAVLAARQAPYHRLVEGLAA